MKPFDLEAAKRGEPIQTRDGRPVKFIAHVPEVVDSFRVVVLIDGFIKTVHEDGRFNEDKTPSFHDIFMSPRKRTVWVNLYSGGAQNFHPSQEEADNANKGCFYKRIGDRAWPLEIEE